MRVVTKLTEMLKKKTAKVIKLQYLLEHERIVPQKRAIYTQVTIKLNS